MDVVSGDAATTACILQKPCVRARYTARSPADLGLLTDRLHILQRSLIILLNLLLFF